MSLIVNYYAIISTLPLFFSQIHIYCKYAPEHRVYLNLGRRIHLRRNKREALVLIAFMFIGSIIGGIVGKLLSYIPNLEFIDKIGKSNILSVNFNPLFDINVIRFGFNLSLGVNIGSIVGIIVAIAIWSRR